MSVVCTRIYDTFIEIAADSQATLGWTAFKDDKSVKIFESELGMIIGAVGSAEPIAMLKIFTKKQVPKEATQDGIAEFIYDWQSWLSDNSKGVSDKNSYHILYKGKAFLADGYYIQEITNYHAIGSGMEYALAALYFGKTAEEAVEVACDLNIYCAPPINRFTMSRFT